MCVCVIIFVRSFVCLFVRSFLPSFVRTSFKAVRSFVCTSPLSKFVRLHIPFCSFMCTSPSSDMSFWEVGFMGFWERGFLKIVFQENGFQEYGISGKWDDSILRKLDFGKWSFGKMLYWENGIIGYVSSPGP